MMQNFLSPVLILIIICISGCTQISENNNNDISYPIPEPPCINEPEPVLLPDKFQNTCIGEEVFITSDVDSMRFNNCNVYVKGSGINITRSEFTKSRIFLESVSHIMFSDNIVKDFPIYEEPAIKVSESRNIIFRHNEIVNNSVGIAIGESQDVIVQNNIFNSNYQHNAVSMYRSSGNISGNHFKYNFPHGVLVHFIPEQGKTTVNIHENIFFMNIEDAINFEDWANAPDISRISNNIITKTAWAGINIEYNSWNANIHIENNYINESGYPIELFPKNPNAPEEWGNGWEHGIRLEDCSGVIVKDNIILDNNENGIDIRNCRDVTLTGNTITGNDVGIISGGANPYSFIRDISPLSAENAAPSIVFYKDNHIYSNNENIIDENV